MANACKLNHHARGKFQCFPLFCTGGVVSSRTFKRGAGHLPLPSLAAAQWPPALLCPRAAPSPFPPCSCISRPCWEAKLPRQGCWPLWWITHNVMGMVQALLEDKHPQWKAIRLNAGPCFALPVRDTAGSPTYHFKITCSIFKWILQKYFLLC